MPRDKTDTHNRLVPCIMDEFLKHGYQKASLTHIAERAGITAAGIYRHFRNKEDMFTSMVEPVTEKFLRQFDMTVSEAVTRLGDPMFYDNFNIFRYNKDRECMNWIYDNYDVFRLLLCCSRGTPYENFEDTMVNVEVKCIKNMFSAMDGRKMRHNDVSDGEMHILCTTFVTAFCEAIKHGYDREKALKHLEFVGKMLYPGIKLVLGF